MQSPDVASAPELTAYARNRTLRHRLGPSRSIESWESVAQRRTALSSASVRLRRLRGRDHFLRLPAHPQLWSIRCKPERDRATKFAFLVPPEVSSSYRYGLVIPDLARLPVGKSRACGSRVPRRRTMRHQRSARWRSPRPNISLAGRASRRPCSARRARPCRTDAAIPRTDPASGGLPGFARHSGSYQSRANPRDDHHPGTL